MTICKRLRGLLSLAILASCALLHAQTKPDINRYTQGQLPTSRLNAPGIAGLCLETDGGGGVAIVACSGGSGSGSGTVTTFSAGTLSPIFTTSVSNAGTTPSLSFTLSNAAAHTYLGNNTGTLGAPGYVSISAADLPGVFPANTTATAHQFFSAYNSGVFTKTQPDYSDLTGTPTLAATIAAVSHKWVNSFTSGTGLFTLSQPDYSDLTGTPVLAANTTATAHQFFTAYTSASGAFTKAQPDYSDLTGTPTLAATLANVAHKWLNSYSSITGLFTQTQPDYSDLTGTPTLAANTTATAHNFFTAFNSGTGAFTKAQPATTDLSDFPSQTGNAGLFLTTNGTTLSWGTPAGGGGGVTSIFGRTGIVTATSGDYSASQVTNAFDVTAADTLSNVTAPATPAAGKTAVYVDSTNKVLSSKNDAGTVSNTVVPSTAATHQFVNSLSAAGALGSAQPGFTDLSGSAACAQEPALSGDVTTTAGSCATTLGTVPIAKGGTGQTTANAALNALLPTQTANFILTTDGTNTSFIQQGWEPLGSTVLGANATSTASVTISARDYIMIVVRIIGYTGTDVAVLQYNADTTAANYATRYVVMSNAATPLLTSVNYCSASCSAAPLGIPMGDNQITVGRNNEIFCTNKATNRKICNLRESFESTSSASTGFNAFSIGYGEWYNTTAQITSVKLVTLNGTSLLAGTGFAVFGRTF